MKHYAYESPLTMKNKYETLFDQFLDLTEFSKTLA